MVANYILFFGSTLRLLMGPSSVRTSSQESNFCSETPRNSSHCESLQCLVNKYDTMLWKCNRPHFKPALHRYDIPPTLRSISHAHCQLHNKYSRMEDVWTFCSAMPKPMYPRHLQFVSSMKASVFLQSWNLGLASFSSNHLNSSSSSSSLRLSARIPPQILLLIGDIDSLGPRMKITSPVYDSDQLFLHGPDPLEVAALCSVAQDAIKRPLRRTSEPKLDVYWSSLRRLFQWQTNRSSAFLHPSTLWASRSVWSVARCCASGGCGGDPAQECRHKARMIDIGA